MEPINLYDYERLARERLHPAAWAYYSSGAEDEITLRENRAAFERIEIIPRMMRGVDSADLRTTALGTGISMPVMVAPTAVHSFATSEGERATARAAGRSGTVMAVSAESSLCLEEISEATTEPLWFQLYVYRARHVAEGLVRRAESAGYRALVLTVDSPRWGNKERFARVEVPLPEGLDTSSIEREFGDQDLSPTPLSWDDFAWLRSLTELPIILKGIFHPDDAKLAVEHGADGIVVSNHGGRQLDGVPASIEAVPHIMEAVGDSVEVYLDGGIRRGTDVLKALALGARIVFVGRPVLWGLAVDGEAGAFRVLEMLREELERAMVLAGQRSVGSLDVDLVRPS